MAYLRKSDGVWEVCWRERGRQRQKKIGPKRQADELKAEVEVRLARGELGVAQKLHGQFQGCGAMV